jgi:PD-(D/E)XK nuclease superfamily
VSSALTPVQQRTLELLGRTGTPVVFDPAIVTELRADFSAALAELAERLPDPSGDGAPVVVVTKYDLGEVFTCEAKWMAPDDFSWSAAKARGQVAHKAIQLLINWRGEIVPITVVDDAIERLADDDRGLGQWLAALSPGDAADLRGRAVEHVTKFLECFPPLDPRWRPVTESTAQYPLSGPIVMRARIDLTLGVPSGGESRKVIVDLKTGRLLHRHREDLRFYALIETLVRDVPPRLLASYSLDSAAAETENVTTDLLRSTLRRTLDGVERMIELRHESRPPTRTPSAACRWCPCRVSCEVGRAWLAADLNADG